MEQSIALQSLAGKWFSSHEDNTDYRMLLLRHCRNGMRISGLFGIVAILYYITVRVLFQDYEISWSYGQSPVKIMVMIDKLIILTLSGVFIGLSFANTGLAVNRAIAGVSVLICALAVLSDNVLNHNIDFSGVHLTIILILTTICIPFRPWQILILGITLDLMLYPGLEIISGWYNVENLSTSSNQALHFSLIVLVMIGMNMFLNHSRHTIYTARRKAEGFIDSLNDDSLDLDTGSDLYREKQLIDTDKQARQLLVTEIDVPDADRLFLEKAQEVIEKNMGDSNFGVEWLAHEVAISPRQLQRRLKSSVGMSAGSLIRVMRLQRSAQLLKQNAGNITEIAYTVGFNDPSYFSRLFKKMHGVNPSEFVND